MITCNQLITCYVRFVLSIYVVTDFPHLSVFIIVSEELIDLHIKLLRKRKKWINKDKWEKSLVKYVHEYSNVDAWELERYGYKNVRLAIKIDVLKVR